ncbi:VacJ family lipoprotein [Candidatus Persebacteraceae bacterium Df01]|jgi:phospholipid-binding lipoprotein MlaA|uniref:VacJ family lipoprotein n=1 Tax=Candidatus Doriopsillibacter californiensis TaxID=2970740 RepID=A0ABT7QKU4_9GAMM|nr:VacJ family lipoprotein [Candidatus Persebacteraceae bacterium Df01]
MTKQQKYCALAFAALLVSGCAPKDYSFEDDGAFDPIEPINRNIYGINKVVDTIIIKPAAKIYTHFPPPLKSGLGNFFNNLGEPSNIINKTLQKQGDDVVTSTARLVFNTTFGLGGLIDIADTMDIEQTKTDFGQTFRAYTGNDGAYLVIPIFGPSSIVDAPGLAAELVASPNTYIENNTVRYSLSGLNVARVRESLLETGELVDVAALDEYSFVRDAREDLRRKTVPTNVWGDSENFWQ